MYGFYVEGSLVTPNPDPVKCHSLPGRHEVHALNDSVCALTEIFD